MWLIGVGAYFWFKILCILYSTYSMVIRLPCLTCFASILVSNQRVQSDVQRTLPSQYRQDTATHDGDNNNNSRSEKLCRPLAIFTWTLDSTDKMFLLE